MYFLYTDYVHGAARFAYIFYIQFYVGYRLTFPYIDELQDFANTEDIYGQRRTPKF